MHFIYIFLFLLFMPTMVLATESINICIPQDNAPFAFVDEDEKLKGFDIDMLEIMQLPYEVKLHPTELATSFAALGSGECDMILSNLTMNNDRKQRYLFSEPHLTTGLYAAVLKNSPIEDTNNLQYSIIGVTKGTVGEDYAIKHFKGSVIYALRDQQNLVKMLNEGRIEAMVDSLPLLQILAQTNNNIHILDSSLMEDRCAYAFSKERADLRNIVSDIIKKMKEDGSIAGLYAKWFGSTNTFNRTH